MEDKTIHEVFKIGKLLAENGIDDSNLVYMPVIPFVGVHEFMVEEYFGMKVARLISPPDDD